MPDPHTLVQPQETTGTLGNRVGRGHKDMPKMWHHRQADGIPEVLDIPGLADKGARPCKVTVRLPWAEEKNNMVDLVVRSQEKLGEIYRGLETMIFP